MPQKILNKKLIESLAKAGALDSLGERRQLVENYEHITAYSKSAGEAGGAQTDLFGQLGTEMDAAGIEFPSTPPATPQQKLLWEKETLGLYVSSHPLAGLRKYIARKAKLVGDLTMKDVNKKVTIAGIQEGIKKIRTKKGETMAILLLEDPSGKIEVTLFPRTFAETAAMLEQPDTVLLVEGTVDFRMGQLQLRANGMRAASLSAMIRNAKEAGSWDEEEFQNGISVSRRTMDLEEETIDALDEEGNVVAGETVQVTETTHPPEEKSTVPPNHSMVNDIPPPALPEIIQQAPPTVHVIDLPAKAPRQLLLDLKTVLESSPGTERVRLNIGGQHMDLPLSITMNDALRTALNDVVERHAVKSTI